MAPQGTYKSKEKINYYAYEWSAPGLVNFFLSDDNLSEIGRFVWNLLAFEWWGFVRSSLAFNNFIVYSVRGKENRRTTSKNSTTNHNHLKNIYNHPQTIEYHLEQAVETSEMTLRNVIKQYLNRPLAVTLHGPHGFKQGGSYHFSGFWQLILNFVRIEQKGRPWPL